MWPSIFAERLESWTQLRHRVACFDLEPALMAVNSWWFQTPWCAYHLHWDDRDYWPNPWQLLNENIYCNLARGLGIMYTIAMLDRADLAAATLAECNSDNLVLINDEKYILNWAPDTIVNINPGMINSRHSVSLAKIKQQLL